MLSACIVGKITVRLFVGALVTDLRPRTIAALVALSLCLPMPRLTAREITPAHVHQVVANLIAELALLHEADFAAYQAGPEPAMPTQRRPRHVIQKARTVVENIQMLRFINGLEMARLAPLPLRDVEPGDVKALVDNILSALRELRAVYGVTATPKPAARVLGITPTDVYAKLVRADDMIDALGLPAVVPNDVRRVALAVVRDLVPADVLELLDHALAELPSTKVAGGIATPTWFAPPVAGKTPNDAFATLGVALGPIDALEQRATGS